MLVDQEMYSFFILQEHFSAKSMGLEVRLGLLALK